jgi:hypothetical protein
MPEQLTPGLRKRLRHAGRKRVQMALDALAHRKPKDPRWFNPESTVAAHLLEFPAGDGANAYYFALRDRVHQPWWDAFLERRLELLACYRQITTDTATLLQRQDWLVSLTIVSAIMVTLLGRAGRYAKAKELAEVHVRAALSDAYFDVAGAGSGFIDGEEIPEVRFILASPPVWALVGSRPK